MRKIGKAVSRVAEVRGFLRFLAVTGKVHPGLESQIDTPRLYRLEQLPRHCPGRRFEPFFNRSLERLP